MSYVVLARKWRPQRFDEVTGQGHVTVTLGHAIERDRVAHAYLFAGPRGVGKTSTARILAKALNCDQAPTTEPCNTCTSCVEITEGRSLDVLEVDGASNRGIDEIRNLRENVRFAAARGRFRIYIIDEVHMLSHDAFNALLKTLEEPPPHVKFIFATTAPHKILPTVLSRCQRFDFKRIAVRDLVAKLEEVATAERLEVGKEALLAVARAADGSLRDAETLLDQLTSSTDRQINAAEVHAMLGLLEGDLLVGVMDRVITGDASGALRVVEQLTSEGRDLTQSASSLLEHVRNLAVARAGVEAHGLIDLPEDELRRVVEQSQRVSLETLLEWFRALQVAQDQMRRAPSARIPFEMALVKMARRGHVPDWDTLVGRVVAIEARVGAAGAQATAGSGRAVGPGGLRPADGGPRGPAGGGRDPVQGRVGAASGSPRVEAPPAVGCRLEDVARVWPSLLEKLRGERMSLATYLAHGRVLRLEGDRVVVGFAPQHDLYREAVDERTARRLIEGHLRELVKVPVRVACCQIEAGGDVAPPAEAAAAPATPQPPSQGPPGGDVIASALKLFRGRIVER